LCDTVYILYCVGGTLIPLWRQMYRVGVLGPLTSRVYVTYHFWTSNCNILGYWKHRSVCYTSLFTTPLVVTAISVYNVLGPSDVVSRSGPGSSLDLLLGFSLICVSGRSFDLSSVCLLCVCPFICCPWNRGFASGIEYTLSQGSRFPC
jgi:hypothetical protein